MTLVAHVDTTRVSEPEVLAVPEVAYTRSWHPIHHGKVVAAVEGQLQSIGIEVARKDYSLTKNGMDMFASWTLDQASEGRAWMIGIRNSMQKNFALGITAGTFVFVCDNRAFNGDFVEFRKHTSGLTDDELRFLAARAVDGVVVNCKQFEEWHTTLREVPVNEAQRKILTYNALDRGILPPSQFKALQGAYKEEQGEGGGDTLHTFHGANTRVMRDASLFAVGDRNKKLTTLCNEYMDAINF
jgi:hypothetical protein